jgi:hypothetical protein
MTFDSGYVARLNVPAARSRCEEGAGRLASGRLEPDTIYLVKPRRARILGKQGLECEPLLGSLWSCRLPAGQGTVADQ